MKATFSLPLRACRVFLALAILPHQTTNSQSADGLTLADIIQNVQLNELLYDNLDITLIETYNSTTATGYIEVNGARGAVIRSRHTETHFVQQDGMFRIDVGIATEYGDKVTGVPEHNFRKRMFDNSVTRLLESNERDGPGVTNLISGRSDDGLAVRLHMLLLRDSRGIIPLSVFLLGGEGIRAYPYARELLSEALDVHVEYKGQENIGEFPCHKIWATYINKVTGRQINRFVLWLAADRNYMPVRSEIYVLNRSPSLPQVIGEVTEWTQLKPGIWCPMAAINRNFDGIILKREGKQ